MDTEHLGKLNQQHCQQRNDIIIARNRQFVVGEGGWDRTR
jgi:hypothetical protein